MSRIVTRSVNSKWDLAMVDVVVTKLPAIMPTPAQRSPAAAWEIKDLITVSVSSVHEGSLPAEEVGRTTVQAAETIRRMM